MQKTLKRTVALFMTAVILTGCGAETAKPQQMTEPVAAEMAAGTEIFESRDGSMDFTMDLTSLPEEDEWIQTEITPYFITGDDVKTICTTLFGEGEYYEMEPSMGAKYSKAELEEAICILETYQDREAMEKMAGAGSPLVGMLPEYADLLKGTKQLLAQGTDENPHQPCDWTFKDFNHYKNSDWDAETDDLALMAEAERNGVRYSIQGFRRETMPYLSLLTIDYGTMMPEYQLMQAVYRSRLCRTAPDNTQVQKAKETALSCMEAFQPGKWTVDSVEVLEEPKGDFTDYSIKVRCTPLLEEKAVLDSFYEDLPREDTRIYAAAYASFLFAPDGQLMQCDLSSPFIGEKSAENPKELIPVDQLLELGKEAMEKLTVYENNAAGKTEILMAEKKAGEEFAGKVLVDRAEVTYGRYETEPGHFQYLPILALWGITEFQGKDSGKTYLTGEKDKPLVMISAVDGKIIED